MNKNTLYKSAFGALLLTFAMFGAHVFASEATGSLNGSVVVNPTPSLTPTPTPTPSITPSPTPTETPHSSGGGGSASDKGKKGDANNDGRVDILDFVSLMAHWGEKGSNNKADFNNDGTVDILDFVLLMANWSN